MPREKDNILYSNFLLPDNFVKRWKIDEIDPRYIYLDFSSDLTVSLELDNVPFIQKLFSYDNSFDEVRIEKQWEQISNLARKIIDLRVINQKRIKLDKQEILLLKYFYFMISLVNGDYKFYLEGASKSYRAFDALSDKIDSTIRHKILVVVEYALFEMFDSLFTNHLFAENLQNYVDESYIDYAEHAMHKRIVIPDDEYANQSFRFVQATFFEIINHNFIKFFNITESNQLSFYLTNKSIVNFISETTKMTLLSVMTIDPYYAMGLVNLGPGRGEYRPFFDYFGKSDLNQIMIPKVLMPEHQVIAEGVYLDENQKYEFMPFQLDLSQINLINEGLAHRLLKFSLDAFYKKSE